MQVRQRHTGAHSPATHEVSGTATDGAAQGPSSTSSSPVTVESTAPPRTGVAASTMRRAAPVFLLNASLAGACGALSGVVGKLAVESARVPALVRSGGACLQLDPGTMALVQATLPWLLRIGFFLLNAVLTGSMWRFYLKALSQGPTPVCQILNTGTNFVVSAFAGLIFFAEEVTPMWAAGALLIVLGLTLVVSDPQVRV